MNINQGLCLDGNLEDKPVGSWLNARNVVLDRTKQSGKVEAGFDYIESVLGQIFGYIEVSNETIFFVKDDGGMSKIVRFKDDIATVVFQDLRLNFHDIVKGTYTYNYKGELIIVWCDGIEDDSNYIKILNLDSFPFELHSDKTIKDSQDFSLLYLSSVLSSVNIKLNEVVEGGGIDKPGAYHFAIAYKLGDKTISNFTMVSNPVMLYADSASLPFEKIQGSHITDIVAKAISLNISNLSDLYSSIHIAAIHYNENTLSAVKLSPPIVYVGKSLDYTVDSIDSWTNYNIEDVIQNNVAYLKANSLANIEKKLMLGGVTGYEDYGDILQRTANKIKTRWLRKDSIDKTFDNSYKSPNRIFFNRSFKDDEVYALYIGWKLKTGGYLSVNHIPGRIPTKGDTHFINTAIGQVRNYEIHSGAKPDGTMGYWQNKDERYPPDFPELAGQNVRHHRTPNSHMVHEEVEYNHNKQYKFAFYKDVSFTRDEDDNGLPSGTEYIVFTLRNNTSGEEQTFKYCVRTDSTTSKSNVIFESELSRNEYPNIFFAALNILESDVRNIIGDNNLPIYNLYVDKTFGPEIIMAWTTGDPNSPFYETFLDPNHPDHNVGALPSLEPFLIDATRNNVYIGNNNGDDISLSYRLEGGSGNIIGSSIPDITPSEADVQRTTKGIKRHIIALELYDINVPDEIKDICDSYEIFYAKPELKDQLTISQGILTSKTYPTSTDSTPTKERFALRSFDLMYSRPAISSDTYLYRCFEPAENTSVIEPRYKISTPDIVGLNSTRRYANRYIPANNTLIDTIPDSEYFNVYPTSSNSKLDFNIVNLRQIRNNTYLGVFSKELVSTGIVKSLDETDCIVYGNVFISNFSFKFKYPGTADKMTGSLVNLPVQTGNIRNNGEYGNEANIKSAKLEVVRQGKFDPIEGLQKISSVVLTSVHNSDLRHEGEEDFQKVYPYSSTQEVIFGGQVIIPNEQGENIEATSPWQYDNFINPSIGKGYNVAYTRLNIIANPLIYNPRRQFISRFPNRIAVSDVNRTETEALGWRTFRTNSYYDMNIARGPIIKLLANSIRLYIQQEHSLSVAFVKDVLRGSGQDTYLSKGSIFDRDPIELIDSEHGYIGCIDYYAIILTVHGYLVVDSVKKNIFLIGEQPVKISSHLTHDFFKNSLIDNRNNILATYDEDLERIIINQQTTKPFTISFDLVETKWISFHDYNPDLSFRTRDKLYYINHNGSSAEIFRADSKTKFAKYFNAEQHPTFIDIFFRPEQYANVVLQSIIWKTSIFENGRFVWDRTIDELMVYNENQCTGYMPVTNEDWFDTSGAVLVNDLWHYNEVRDGVINDRYPIMMGGEPTENVNKLMKNWYDNSLFICKLAVVRLKTSNAYQLPFYFNKLFVNYESDSR
jgi:hypothetical protein